ncbi:MAG: DoxX family membrane protein [Bacteroidia bacterium]
MEMTLFSITPEILAAATLRITVGVLFAIQGYDKAIKIGVKGVVETVGPSYRNLGFPDFMIRFISFFTSWTELLAGVMLVAGVFTLPAAGLLCLDLIIVTAGMSLLDPVQELRIIFPRLLLLVIYLLFAAHLDTLSIDRWL